MEDQKLSTNKLAASAPVASEISASKRYQQRTNKNHAADNNNDNGNKSQPAANQQDRAPALLNQGKENHTSNNQINFDLLEQKFCFECNRSLAKSRHLINIAGKMHKWHPECFRCHVCNNLLERESSCHVYKDKILCHNDYAKLQRDNSTKCARCRWPIAASDWVRKAGKYVYHLACFTCDICLRQLSTGEQFTINIQEKELVRLLCRLHFDVNQSYQQQPEQEPSHDHHLAANSDHTGSVLSEPGSGSMVPISSSSNPLKHGQIPQTFEPTAVFCGGKQMKGFQSEGGFNRNQYLQLLAAASCTANSAPADCQKPQTQSEFDFSGSGLTCQLQMDNDLMNGQQQQQQVQARRPGPISSTSSSNSSSTTRRLIGVEPSGIHTSKSKRVRTTFTEDQLAILQRHFQRDSNPDGQDLEQIATITGLSKRVTQVWFQNSRARQKKYMIKRKPTSSSSLANQNASAHGLIASGSGANQQPGNHLFAHSSHQAIATTNKENYQGRANLSDKSELSLDEKAALDCLAEDHDGSSMMSNDDHGDDGGITISEEEDEEEDGENDEEGLC